MKNVLHCSTMDREPTGAADESDSDVEELLPTEAANAGGHVGSTLLLALLPCPTFSVSQFNVLCFTEPRRAGAGLTAKVEATLEECLTLLRGSSDEKRLVGLLLVTKFLQSDSEATLQVRVHVPYLRSRWADLISMAAAHDDEAAAA